MLKLPLMTEFAFFQRRKPLVSCTIPSVSAKHNEPQGLRCMELGEHTYWFTNVAANADRFSRLASIAIYGPEGVDTVFPLFEEPF
jgi:hypothetical protein